MQHRFLLVLTLVLLFPACSTPADVFKVETSDGVTEATLSACGETTALTKTAGGFIGSRVTGCEEGSGHIHLSTRSGAGVRCDLGYVAVQPPFGEEGFYYGFKVQTGACVAERTLWARNGGDVTEQAARACRLQRLRKHVFPSGKTVIGYFEDEQSTAAARCIEHWRERQLNI
jgi:hypothetical protein